MKNYTDLIAAPRTKPLSDRLQLRATQDGDLRTVKFNKISRFFVKLVRTQSVRDSHRAGAHAYIAHVRRTQGFEAANFAEAALSNRISKGKPVSMRKIRALESAWQGAVQGARAFQAMHLVDAGEKLGSGSNNTVTKATFKNGADVMTGALKPLGSMAGAALLAGRDDDLGTETHVLERNLATQRLAERIGAHVIAGGVPAQTAQGKPALLMELVHGQTVPERLEAHQEVLDGPELRRGLVGLQVVDILTAQVDRNLDNIMLKRESGRDIPVGIDNDISFVTASSLTELHSYINSKAKPVGMPVVLDESMCEKVISMTRQDLASIMGPNLATPGRLDAAADRLAELQAHIQSGRVLVVADNDWHNPQVKHLLERDDDNYWHQVMHARPEASQLVAVKNSPEPLASASSLREAVELQQSSLASRRESAISQFKQTVTQWLDSGDQDYDLEMQALRDINDNMETWLGVEQAMLIEAGRPPLGSEAVEDLRSEVLGPYLEALIADMSASQKAAWANKFQNSLALDVLASSGGLLNDALLDNPSPQQAAHLGHILNLVQYSSTLVIRLEELLGVSHRPAMLPDPDEGSVAHARVQQLLNDMPP